MTKRDEFAEKLRRLRVSCLRSAGQPGLARLMLQINEWERQRTPEQKAASDAELERMIWPNRFRGRVKR